MDLTPVVWDAKSRAEKEAKNLQFILIQEKLSIA